MRGRESRWPRAAPWEKEGVSEREHGVEKVDSTMQKGKFQGGKRGQAKRASIEQVEGSMSGRVDAKALQDDLKSLGFATSLAKSEIGKGGWEMKSPLIR